MSHRKRRKKNNKVLKQKKDSNDKLFIDFLVFISILTTLSAKDNIEVYNHYGNSHNIVIEGRMLYNKNSSKVSKDDGKLINLWRKLSQLINDEIKNSIIFANLNNEQYVTIGDDEGYFKFEIKTKKSLNSGYEDIKLNMEDNQSFQHIKIPIFTQKSVGIISDFDDTIIISNVTDKLRLLKNSLLKNYKQRTIIPTMLERFKKVLSQNPINQPTALFFITGSPQQLNKPIEQFLTYHNFPEHVLITKKVHGIDTDQLLDQFTYKTKKIQKLIEFYPNLEWVMFGDSGEKDREVYSYLTKQYPSKIKAFYIRDVKSGEIKIAEPFQ